MKAACQEVPAISLQKGERDTGKLWATQEHSHESRQRSEAAAHQPLLWGLGMREVLV